MSWLDEDADAEATTSQVEYDRLARHHHDAGYRDGITQGKNEALQPGFDVGFALGVPVASEVGRLRGLASSLLAFLLASSSSDPGPVDLVRRIIRELGKISGPQDFEELRDKAFEAHLDDHVASERGKASAANVKAEEERHTEAAMDLEQLHVAVPPALRGKREVEDLSRAMEGMGKQVEQVDGRQRLERCRLELRQVLREVGIAPELA